MRAVLSDNPMWEAFGNRALVAPSTAAPTSANASRRSRASATARVDDWHREWVATADRVAAIGDDSAAAGHRVSAREAYFRACTYYRAVILPALRCADRSAAGRQRSRAETAVLRGGGRAERPADRGGRDPLRADDAAGILRHGRRLRHPPADHRPHQRLRLHHPGDVLRPRAGGHPPRLQHPPLRRSRPGPQPRYGRHPHPPRLGERGAPVIDYALDAAGHRPGRDRPGGLELRRLPGAAGGRLRAPHRRPDRRSRSVG